MKNLISILILLCAFSASAAQRITALITVTNVADTGDTIVVNAASRFWTNANSSSTILTNLVGKNQTATNLYNQIATYPYTGPITVRYADTNQIQLIGALDGALAVTVAGGWATVALSTQSGPQTYTALWPIENIVAATNRTNQASAFVGGMSTYATNAFATNSSAMSNFITKGASPPQSITSELRIGGNINNGTGSLSVSNLVNRGAAIWSFGIGANSLQLGSNAVSAGLRTVAVGNNAYATNDEATAIGYAAIATNKSVALGASAVAGLTAAAIGRQASALYESSTAIGNATIASGGSASAIGHAAEAATNATAVGRLAQANSEGSTSLGYSANVDTSSSKAIAIGSEATVSTGNNSIAIGAGATATHSNSVVIGQSAASTTTNQIRLGTSSETISIPGVLEVSGTQTNTTWTGTNVLSGRLTLTARSNTGLANGYNSGVVLGTNVYIRFSGPSAAYTNAGFASAPDGTYHVAQFDNPGLSFTILDNSGTEATAANRVYTGTGALINSTNNPAIATMIYDGSVSRWRVISFR